MESKIRLNNGETIRQISHKMKGSMQEMDIYDYEILNENNEVVGTIHHTDHTAIKGFKRIQTVTQKDNQGNIIIDIAW